MNKQADHQGKNTLGGGRLVLVNVPMFDTCRPKFQKLLQKKADQDVHSHAAGIVGARK